MDTLGIDVDAEASDNMKTFKKITVDTKEFTYDELVVWFQTLSKLSACRGMAACAEEYAHRIVVEDEMDLGRYWLKLRKGGVLVELHEEVALSRADGFWVGT